MSPLFEQTAAPLRLKEGVHRRRLLLGAVSLILLPTFFIVAHHLPVDIADQVPTVQHVLGLCLAAVSELLSPVHWLFHVALIAGLAYAVHDRFRALRSLRRILSELDMDPPEPGSDIWNAAIDAGLDPSVVRVCEGLPNPAFTAGTVYPRIYVSTDLGTDLSHAELAMVLAHEWAHVQRRDPLRLTVYRFLSCAFFWIPALRRLSDDIADEAEIEADNAAAGQSPLTLASAILRLAEAPAGSRIPATVGLQNPDLLDRRIRRLAGEETSLVTRLTRRSVAGACLSIALVFASGVAAMQAAPTHCRHDHAFAFTHLVCNHTECSSLDSHCPHLRPS